MIKHGRANLVLPPNYIDEATRLASKAKKRIYLISLSIFQDQATDDFIKTIISAANRGVEVHIAADYLTFVYALKSLRPFFTFMSGKNIRRADSLRKDFQGAGAEFHWLGSKMIPFLLGRTHSKWCVIDDDIFSFGGVNTEEAAIYKQTDYMIKLTDQVIADALVHEQRRIEQADIQMRPLHNHSLETEYGTVLFDSGEVGRSIIYASAIELAREAESIIFVSQYCPTGRLGEILRRKSNAQVYFNQKWLAKGMNKFMVGSRHAMSEQNNLYNRNRYVHSKFMIATMANGSKRAITGSHNFASAGAHMGTREIALETTDPEIIDQLEKFYCDNIK